MYAEWIELNLRGLSRSRAESTVSEGGRYIHKSVALADNK